MAPELPEDCYYLIKKAVSIRKHLERNRKDKDAKFRLILVESRIHRLARYWAHQYIHQWPLAVSGEGVGAVSPCLRVPDLHRGQTIQTIRHQLASCGLLVTVALTFNFSLNVLSALLHYSVVNLNVSPVCRYYKTKGVLPPTWKYESSTASTLVA